jgi:hypothetical protein
MLGRSAFNGAVQAITMGAPRWQFTIETGAMRASETPQWEAFITRLGGKVHRARCWDWRRESPLGPGGASPTLQGNATGITATVQGLTANQNPVLRAGSYLGINGELKRLSVDAVSNGSGVATVTFEPPLRATAPGGSAVVLTRPTALFILVNDRFSFSQRGARHTGGSLSFEEVFL